MIDFKQFALERIDFFNGQTITVHESIIKDDSDAITRYLMSVPAFAKVMKGLDSDKVYTLVYKDGLKRKIESGAARHMRSSDGRTLFADILGDKGVVGKARLKEVSPDQLESLSNLVLNQKLDMIAAQLEAVSEDTRELLIGQSIDRRGFILSSFNTFLQAVDARQKDNRRTLFMSAISDAETGRSQIMLQMNELIDYSKKLSPTLLDTMFNSGSSSKKIKSKYITGMLNYEYTVSATMLIAFSHILLKEYASAKNAILPFIKFTQQIAPAMKGLADYIPRNQIKASDDRLWYNNGSLAMVEFEKIILLTDSHSNELVFRIGKDTNAYVQMRESDT